MNRMSDFIDRQKAIEAILNLSDVYVNNLPPMKYATDVQEAVYSVPAEDVVEVVRCNDCKWSHPYQCAFVRTYIRKDDYCSRGERKD